MDKHIAVLEELASRLDGYEQRSACMAHWGTQSGQRDDADYWSQHAKDMNSAAHEIRAAIALMRGQSEVRYFASGPEGYFWSDSAVTATAIIRQCRFDRNDWTVTDLHLPTTPKDDPADEQ